MRRMSTFAVRRGRTPFRPVSLLFCGMILLALTLPTLAVEIGPNLVEDPGFEEGIDGWQERGEPITRDGEVAHTGDWSLRIDSHPELEFFNFHYVRGEDIPAEPNIRYHFSVWMRGALGEGESRPRVREVDAEGNTIRYHGLAQLHPGERDWRKVEVEFVTSPRAHALQPYLITSNAVGAVWYDEVRLERLPPPPIEREPGEAVTFRGSPGSLEMAVTNVEATASGHRVTTTGAVWEIDAEAGTIVGRQRIGADREMIALTVEPAPGAMEVLRSDESVCVLRSPLLEVGVQCDGLLVLAPDDSTEVEAEGRVGGEWAEFERGNVQVTDDVGGVCVFPWAPGGSGLVVGYDEPQGDLAESGWRAGWSLGRGMLLGVAIYPPREFDWEKSFDWQLAHTGGYPPDSALETWSRYVRLITLHENIWAGEQPTPHTGPYVAKQPEELRRIIATCERLGVKLLVYMSPHYYVDQSIDAFMTQMTDLRDEFGFHGVFFDGVYFTDWVKSYEVMRLTREAFPEGPLYLHSSKGAPLGGYDLWCPFVDAYADITLRGEGRVTEGADADYVRYVAAGYRLSNAIGMMKGDRWDVADDEQTRIMLGYNGRERMVAYPRSVQGQPVFPGEDGLLDGHWTEVYWPLLQQMRARWKAGALDF